jgi:hypothetical protein
LQQSGFSDPGWALNEQGAATARQPIDELLSARNLRGSSEEGR